MPELGFVPCRCDVEAHTSCRDSSAVLSLCSHSSIILSITKGAEPNSPHTGMFWVL